MRTLMLILILGLAACQSGYVAADAPVRALVTSEPARQAAAEAVQAGESASEAAEEAAAVVP